ncbi:MAG TPA: LrgB family protein [Kiloniellales bacterium]|nr:LrgB family protein [Kiloniellales bacterium]
MIGEELWVYLRQSPLLWLTVTLVAYMVGYGIYTRSGKQAWANPLLLSVGIVIAILLATGTPYDTYFEGAQFVHFLLGPVTVALAVPLFRNLAQVRQALGPIVIALVTGSLTAIVSGVGIAWLLDADRQTVLSLAPKSITTPVAMGVAEEIGGLPSLTAVLVVLTGTLGSVIALPLFRLLRVRDSAAQGFALGLTAHGIGTARAFTVDDLAGSFAGLAMGLNALVTAIFVPLLLPLLS